MATYEPGLQLYWCHRFKRIEALEGRWPWPEMHAALASVGARVIDSHDAGRYVCESTYWSLLARAASTSWPEFAAFLHVPHESAQNPLEHIAAAVDSVVQARRTSLLGRPESELQSA